MPHPNERRVLIQIQVYPGKGSALKALADGLEGLKQVCEVVKTTFQVSFIPIGRVKVRFGRQQFIVFNGNIFQ